MLETEITERRRPLWGGLIIAPSALQNMPVLAVLPDAEIDKNIRKVQKNLLEMLKEAMG